MRIKVWTGRTTAKVIYSTSFEIQEVGWRQLQILQSLFHTLAKVAAISTMGIQVYHRRSSQRLMVV
jgi:hypothetical protein